MTTGKGQLTPPFVRAGGLCLLLPLLCPWPRTLCQPPPQQGCSKAIFSSSQPCSAKPWALTSHGPSPAGPMSRPSIGPSSPPGRFHVPGAVPVPLAALLLVGQWNRPDLEGCPNIPGHREPLSPRCPDIFTTVS